MSKEALLILLFILLMAIAIPYMFRANFQTKLQKCKANNDYQGALKIVENRFYIYLKFWKKNKNNFEILAGNFSFM